jgi:hypothetical protein
MASHIQNNRKLADLEHVGTKCIILCNYILFCVYATKIRSIVVKLPKRKKERLFRPDSSFDKKAIFRQWWNYTSFQILHISNNDSKHV